MAGMLVVDKGDNVFISRNIFEHREVIGKMIWVYFTAKLYPGYNDLLIANELDMNLKDVAVALYRLRDMGYIKYNQKFHCKLPRNRIMPRKLYDGYIDDNDECAICGSTDDLTIDHIKPVARGGKSTNNNLQILCRSCNNEKADKYNER